MLNCWACPLYLDCKVEQNYKEVSTHISFPRDKSHDALEPNPRPRILTPVAEADCPLKRAVEMVNKQIDRINSLGINK